MLRAGTQAQNLCYKSHRFPHQIIAHFIWRYARFNLIRREIEELMLERCVNYVEKLSSLRPIPKKYHCS